MKKSILMLGLGLASLTASAQSVTPFKGAVLDKENGGEYFLYNVNTGRWLQNNDDNNSNGYWTTRGEMGTRGMIFKIKPRNNGDEGAMQLDPQFGANHSMNISGFYLDTGQEVSTYYIDDAGVDEVSNGVIISGDLNGDYPYLTVNADGWLDLTTDDAAENNVWQLVTKEERLKYMADNATTTSPIDATWLIDGATFAAQDERNNTWVHSDTKTYDDGLGSNGWAISGDGGYHNNRVLECYNRETFSVSQTISGLPNGTYELSIQGFYRDGMSEERSGNKNYSNRHFVVDAQAAGTEEIKAYYFANGSRHDLMSILDDSKSEAGVEGYGFNALMTDGEEVVSSGQWVPNSTDACSKAFFNGGYKNPAIKATVADGNLQVGVRKDEGTVSDNWIVIDNFNLKYLGSQVDVSEVKKDLKQAIDDAAAVTVSSTTALNKRFADAKSAADDAYNNSSDATVIASASTELKAVTTLIKQTASAYSMLKETLAAAKNDGVTGDAIDNAADQLENAVEAQPLNDAIGSVRVARRIFHADKSENVFTGNAPAEGQFYLYNVYTKRFFCGGADWGAHAAVGYPGYAVNLVASTEPNSFVIDTRLQNGTNEHYLNYGGYCDTGTQDPWTFTSVGDGKYTISRTNASDSEKEKGNYFLGYRPGTYETIDTDMNQDEVGNEWILVTKADRDALLANASESNPVDATHLVKMPGFNQREYVIEGGWDDADNGAWTHENGGIWGRGANHTDFAFECYNADPLTLTQTISDLKPGYYFVQVQGYYRDGSREAQVETVQAGLDPQQLANLVLENGDGETAEAVLPTVNSCTNAVPGIGWENALGRFPDSCTDACTYFENGLYKTGTMIEVLDDGQLTISIEKEGGVENDWVVVDNFRLVYYGEQQPTGINGVIDADAAKDAKVYTIDGMQVKDASQRGIYIKNGKKFVVK